MTITDRGRYLILLAFLAVAAAVIFHTVSQPTNEFRVCPATTVTECANLTATLSSLTD